MSKWINETRSVELRAIDKDENRFEGLACKYDVVDSYGTRFIAGCFTRGGLDTNGTYSLLWMHDPTRPVGTFSAEERSDGLYIVGKWDDNTAGREARVAAMSGSASDLSVGFTWMKEDSAEENDITIARLQEVSQVTSRFGAVPGSVLTAVRSAIEAIENEEDADRYSTEYHHNGAGEVIQGSPEAEEAETVEEETSLEVEETEEERAALGGDMYTTQAEAAAKAAELGCEGTHSMQMNGETVYMPCSTHSDYENIAGESPYRAEAGELMEGDFVSFVSGTGTDYGRVEYIMTDGVFGIEGDPLSPVATEDDPFALVRLYDKEDNAYEPTSMFVGKRFSELTKLAPVMDAPQELEEESVDENNRSLNLAVLARYIDTL